MDVVTAIDLSRATVRRIRMNMCWSLLYNIIAVPIAAGALITVGVKLAPWMAAAAMSLSDVTVVTSSLFLKLYVIMVVCGWNMAQWISFSDIKSLGCLNWTFHQPCLLIDSLSGMKGETWMQLKDTVCVLLYVML